MVFSPSYVSSQSEFGDRSYISCAFLLNNPDDVIEQKYYYSNKFTCFYGNYLTGKRDKVASIY